MPTNTNVVLLDLTTDKDASDVATAIAAESDTQEASNFHHYATRKLQLAIGTGTIVRDIALLIYRADTLS